METRPKAGSRPARIVAELNGTVDGATLISDTSSGRLRGGPWRGRAACRRGHRLRTADLVFLPAGNATLSRRAKQASRLSAVVVRFSRARKRYERQGVLVARQL